VSGRSWTTGSHNDNTDAYPELIKSRLETDKNAVIKGAVPIFQSLVLNTLEAVKDTDDKLSPTVIREGNNGQEPSSTAKTHEK